MPDKPASWSGHAARSKAVKAALPKQNNFVPGKKEEDSTGRPRPVIRRTEMRMEESLAILRTGAREIIIDREQRVKEEQQQEEEHARAAVNLTLQNDTARSNGVRRLFKATESLERVREQH